MTDQPPDHRDIEQRVRKAVEAAGDDAVLLGYDANGVQELLSATQRPKIIRSSSEAFKGFDAWVRDQQQRGTYVFAGGARGLLVLPRRDVESTANALRQKYERVTFGGRLGITVAPFAKDAEERSLELFRVIAANSKDEADPPDRSDLPTFSANGVCADCWERDGTIAVEERFVCARCLRFSQGAGDDTREKSLSDLAKGNRFAVLSGDGNDMGPFFAQLTTLASTAYASAAVQWIFSGGLTAVLRGVPEKSHVVATSGGDDLRVFLDPAYLPALISQLFEEIHERCRTAASAPILGEQAAHLRDKMGIGMGALVVDSHYSSRAALAVAHELERTAKKFCKEKPARSAVNLRVATSGAELSQRDAGARETVSDVDWPRHLHRAEMLARVPRSQRAPMREAMRAHEGSKFDNLFRYQVARDASWRELVGLAARDPNDCAKAAPSEAEYDLASIIEAENRRSERRDRR